MRLYLSSFKIGNYPDKLLDLLGEGRKACIISNAVDNIPADKRVEFRKNVYNPHKAFADIGIQSEELDLKAFFGTPEKLREVLQRYDLVWVVGGNTFLLLRAMVQSGFKPLIQEMLKDDQIVYGGFSAGACVAAPTLKGIDLMDQPHDVAEGYDPAIIWDALSLIDFSIIPHYQSDHLEAPLAEKAVEYVKKHNMPFKTLKDGDVIIKHGQTLEIYET